MGGGAGPARRARAAGLLEASRTGIEEALGVWRGAPIAGAGAHGLLDGERARLEEERLAAAIEGLEIDLELGRHGDLVGQLEALVSAHPFKERLVALQMVALYRCGRQSDALEVYTRSRRRLDEELGLEPSSQLRRLEEAILRQDPSLEVAIGEPIPQRQPRALPPSLPAQLQPRPAMPFVGRAAELGRLAALLDRARTDGRQIALVVMSARSPAVELTASQPRVAITSPVTVEGRGRGFEGSVRIEVRAVYASAALADRAVVAGSMDALEPFSTELTFTPPAGVATGAIVAESGSGSTDVGAFAALPVRF